VTDPRLTESEQLLTAVRPPKCFVTLRTSITKSEDTKSVPIPEAKGARFNPGDFAASAHKADKRST